MIKHSLKPAIMSIALTALVPAVSFADYCASWGCVGDIKTLYTNSNGVIYVGMNHDENIANCTPVSGVYFTLNDNAGNKREVYSSLLSSYISGKKIVVRIKENTPNCEILYVYFDTQF